MSYEFYKVTHLTGIFMMMLAVGAHILNGFNGGNKVFPGKRFFGILHGIGLLTSFIAGFGLMARLGLFGGGWPLWIHLKIAVWVAFGAFPVLPRRMPKYSALLGVAILLVGVSAAYFARFKPM